MTHSLLIICKKFAAFLSLSIVKTLYVNYIAFGPKGLLRLPIFVYNNTKIKKIGNIIIHCPLHHGILRIGNDNLKASSATIFLNCGIINIYNEVECLAGVLIENYGTIDFLGNAIISNNSMLLVREKLTIGNCVRVGFNSILMDSDDHYLLDVETGNIERNTKPIRIGDWNWLGYNTFVKKGTITRDYTIVAAPNSVLCKDYQNLPKYSLLAGTPARFIKVIGKKMVYDKVLEHRFRRKFWEDSSIQTIDINNFSYENK